MKRRMVLCFLAFFPAVLLALKTDCFSSLQSQDMWDGCTFRIKVRSNGMSRIILNRLCENQASRKNGYVN